ETAAMGSESPLSPLRAWLAVVALTVRRQARMRQMVWIAVGLLALVLVNIVGARVIRTRTAARQQPQLLGPAATEARYADPWSLAWRFTRRSGPTYGDMSVEMNALGEAMPLAPDVAAFERMAAGAFEAVLQASRFLMFARGVLFSLFLSFLLPLWSLSFSTEALGGEREA